MYACIKGGVVANVIVADHDFIQHIEKDYDFIVPAVNAGIGWGYDEINGFIAPVVNDPNIIDAEVIDPTPVLEAPKKTSSTKSA